MSDYWNNLSRMLGANPNHLRDEFAKIEELLGEPWKKAKKSMEVHRVRIEKYAP